MQNPLNCGVSGCLNYPIRITPLFSRYQRILVFLLFSFRARRKFLDALSPTVCGSPHNRKSIRTNSPETKSNQKGLETSNVKGKNLCNLMTAEKQTNFLGQYMHAMCFNTTLTTWILQKEPQSKSLVLILEKKQP